jgi:16S rRNA (guanine1207-N2)-methyltransferase
VAGASQYFDSNPAVPSRPGSIELVLPDARFTLTTDRGVFSGDAVDAGTKLLLLELPTLSGTNLLDLGCGYGPLALTLAHRVRTATVWAVDVNERALALCAANATANALGNVRAVLPAAVPVEVEFDAIVSNPPIRIGKPALHSLLLEWLPRLRPGGKAWFVVQKHLGSDSLATWLGAQGWTASRLVARSGYRVLEVARA